MALNERIEWARRISRALAGIKADGTSELTRRAGLIALPLAATIASGCGYNANAYKKNASQQPYSTTTTTGAYTWNAPLSNGASTEEEAERKDREERETAERQARAQEQRGTADASGATAPGTGPATVSAEDQSAFKQKLKNQLSSLDSDVDDIRSRAAMAGDDARTRVEPILKEVAARRAQLEQSRKKLDTATGPDWTRARDEAQGLLDDVKARVHAARDAL